MKEIILRGRGEGKTRRIIELATRELFQGKNDCVIVLPDIKSLKRVENMLDVLCFKKLRPELITFVKFVEVRGSLKRTNKTVFIDDLEICIKNNIKLLRSNPNIQLMDFIEGFSCSSSFNKMDHVCYISGPISGLNKHDYTINYSFAENYLIMNGLTPISPLKIKHYDVQDWEECMKKDIQYLMHCDQIFVLKGWRESKGSIMEVELAQKLGMKITFE